MVFLVAQLFACAAPPADVSREAPAVVCESGDSIAILADDDGDDGDEDDESRLPDFVTSALADPIAVAVCSAPSSGSRVGFKHVPRSVLYRPPAL